MSAIDELTYKVAMLERELERVATLEVPLTRIGARVYNSGSISITSSGVFTAISFTAARWDTDGLWSSGSADRLTCTRAGVYLLAGHVRFAANASGERGLQLQIGSATSIASIVVPAASNGNVTDLSIATFYQLAVGNYVRLLGYQTSGGALSVSATGNISPEFAMHRIA